MTMMFEVQDLAVASPATVSRCGMVYLEPSILGLQPFVDCWLRKLPDSVFDYKDTFKSLFDRFLEVCLIFSTCFALVCVTAFSKIINSSHWFS
jgi:dynein heavy chain